MIRKSIIASLIVCASAMANGQEVYSLKKCIETGLEKNYSIRIIKNEQQKSKNNATPGNAGYLPTLDLNGPLHTYRRDCRKNEWDIYRNCECRA